MLHDMQFRVLSESSPGDGVARVDRGVGAVGVALIFAFWTLFGLVMTVAILRSPIRQNTSAPWELVAFSFLGAYVWAALTLPLFALVRRLDLSSLRTALGFVLLFAVGFATAFAASSAVSFASSYFIRETLNGALTTWRGVWRMIDYRYLTDLFACTLILAAAVSRDFFIRYRERQEEANLLRTQLAEARHEALRAQLDPHLLFNTLNAVAALVSHDPKGVRRMIASLSDILRHSLKYREDLEIPLEQEIELTRRYLEIIEIRYQGQVETRVTVDPAVRLARVPNLIIQPLVENAMKHGVGMAGGRGRVEVIAKLEEGEVVITVTDTGHGSPARSAPGPAGSGLGLTLTEERLKLAYGERGTVRLFAGPDGGTAAEIRLPYRGPSLGLGGEPPPSAVLPVRLEAPGLGVTPVPATNE